MVIGMLVVKIVNRIGNYALSVRCLVGKFIVFKLGFNTLALPCELAAF